MVLLNCQSFAVTQSSSSVWTAITKSTMAKVEAEAYSIIDGDLDRFLGKQRPKVSTSVLFHNELKYSSCSSTISPPPSYYGHLIQAFSKETSLVGGVQVHAHIIKRGLGTDPFLQTRMHNLYSKCECLELAGKVFDTGNVRTSIVSWNSMISLYCKYRSADKALSLFLELLLSNTGLEPDQFTFSSIIRMLQEKEELSIGRQLHSLAIRSGYGEEEFVVSSLVKMYAACRRISDSVCVFTQNAKDFSAAAWNSIIAQLVELKYHVDAFHLHEHMLHIGTKPTPLTFSSLIKSCADKKALDIGEQIHTQIIVRGFSSNMILETALVDLYAKCGDIEQGRLIFERMEQRNVITWNSMIRGYSQRGCSKQAMQLFGTMRKEYDIVPDKFTFPALLAGANYSHGDLESKHAYVLKLGLERDCFIGTCLITAYSTKNELMSARSAFEAIDHKDMGAWSSMISACVKAGEEGEEALNLAIDMLNFGIQPNQFVYSSLLMVCGELPMSETGKQIHAHSLKSSEAMDTATKNALITMYSNCGYIQEARTVFNSLEIPNVISFNSMISALAQHASPQGATKLFEQMEEFGLKPDEITILNLLTAFNHAGLVHNGLDLFNSMETNQGIKPTYQHYACVVDMLCRAGEIEQAMRFIHGMPVEPSPSLWRSVLGACSKHRNLEVGKKVADLLLELEPYEATNYVLLANNFARTGKWLEAERVRNVMKEKSIEKEVGLSWIEINKTLHIFRVEDRSHPLSEQIHARLRELIKDIKAIGYVPDISFTLHDMNDDTREESLYYHTEKLAFAFGDLSAAQGVTLRIMKNLRVCGDCHCAYKHFSLITGRAIMLKDKFRFHHFTNGQCSCGDHW